MRYTLHEALSVFSDNLEEIQKASLDNVNAILKEYPKPEVTGDENLDWVRGEVHALRVQKATAPVRRTLKAVTARLQARTQKRFAPITDTQIEAARAYPIEELHPQPESIRNRMGLCPFHTENTGSFHIFKDNRWKCFGCSEHGDAIDFYQKLHNTGFIQAVRALQ